MCAALCVLTRTTARQVTVTCERGSATHVFDISMTSEEPELHEVIPAPTHNPFLSEPKHLQHLRVTQCRQDEYVGWMYVSIGKGDSLCLM